MATTTVFGAANGFSSWAEEGCIAERDIDCTTPDRLVEENSNALAQYFTVFFVLAPDVGSVSVRIAGYVTAQL